MAWYDGIKNIFSSLIPDNNSSDQSISGNIPPHSAANSGDGLEDFIDTTWSSAFLKF